MGSEMTRLSVAISSTVDGLEMGVLSDGRAYLSGRGLAKLCGTAVSTIINQGQRWLTGERSNKLAQLLVGRGLDRPSLYEIVKSDRMVAGSDIVHAYPADICTAILEYYAFDTAEPTEQALKSARALLRGGLSVFIYHALGYDPSNRVPQAWRHFHDRQLLHSVPRGYFSVFKECSDFEMAIIRAGLPMDEGTVPDISVGQAWSRHWQEKGLEAQFGARMEHDHNYPDSFRQSASNPQPMKVYPVAALGAFRTWMDTVYIPEKFPRYLRSKVAAGVLPASTAELLLAEVTPPELPEST